jgi:hypothetical protein
MTLCRLCRSYLPIKAMKLLIATFAALALATETKPTEKKDKKSTEVKAKSAYELATADVENFKPILEKQDKLVKDLEKKDKAAETLKTFEETLKKDIKDYKKIENIVINELKFDFQIKSLQKVIDDSKVAHDKKFEEAKKEAVEKKTEAPKEVKFEETQESKDMTAQLTKLNEAKKTLTEKLSEDEKKNLKSVQTATNELFVAKLELQALQAIEKKLKADQYTAKPAIKKPGFGVFIAGIALTLVGAALIFLTSMSAKITYGLTIVGGILLVVGLGLFIADSKKKVSDKIYVPVPAKIEAPPAAATTPAA